MTDNGTNDKPILDLDELSWGDTKALISAGATLTNGKASITEQMAAMSCIEQLIGPLVVSIPRAWLVKRAPEVMDYSKAGAFDYLRKDKFLELVNVVMTAQTEVSDNSKN